MTTKALNIVHNLHAHALSLDSGVELSHVAAAAGGAVRVAGLVLQLTARAARAGARAERAARAHLLPGTCAVNR